MVALAGPAAGQAYDPNYPVCIHVYGGRFGGNYIDCRLRFDPAMLGECVRLFRRFAPRTFFAATAASKAPGVVTADGIALH